MTLQFRWRSSSKDNFPFKRSKVQRACHLCRQKKMRCDGKKPCDRCQSLAQECIYDDKPSPQRQKQPKRRVHKVQQELLNSDNSSQSSKNEEDAEATEEQQSRRRQSSPKSQPQSAVTREDENRIYCRRNLKRISFSNTIYESMRQQNHNKSYLYATQLPPLLLDFFNLTAQPHGIWSHFTTSLRNFRFHPTAQSALELNQQTLALFAAHNLLYSSLFDFSGLTAALEIGGSYPFTTPDATSAPVTVESLLIYAIFALVLHAAYQSLSTKVPKLSDDLMDYANTFYREAHRRFIALTFPATSSSSTSCCSPSSSPTASDKTMLFSLAQAAVLLTHYQCAAVCEGQAHMTLQMGVAFAQRCALFADISATGNVDIKRRKALATILNSWRAWFAFYLHLEDWPSNDIWPEEPIEPRFCPTTEDSREAYQLWAMDATSAYSHFLLRLSTTKMRIPEVRKWLDMLQAWSAPSPCDPPGSDSHVPPKTSETSSLPASILLLFHQVLTIQVYLCQTTAFSDVFQSISTVGDDSDGQKTQVDSLALDLCDIAASEIVHAVDNLTVNNHAPVVSEVEPFRRRPQQPITLAVLYPLSLATSTTVACLRRRVSDREDAETSSKAAAPPAIPAFKLQRLLNPVCSQMEAANVIYGPLHEIMAAAKHSTNTRTMLTMTENQRAMRGPAADNHRSGNSTRSNMSDPLHWYDSFPEDGFFNEARITPMAHPTLDVMSRNVMREKIDQEQLEKLSHNKNAMSSSSNLDLFAARAGLDAYGMPLMSLTHSNSTTTRARAASASSHPKGQNMLTMMPGQKRQYFPPGLDLVQQQQVPQDSSAMAVKRMRTETSCSDNNESLMRSQEMLRARDNGLNIPDMSDPAALQVYSENYLFMFENPITATSTTAVAAATDQNQFLLPHKDRSETFISSIIGNSTASGGMVGSLSIVPPKLPLPTPKQRNVNTKSWTATSASGQKDWNVDFQESIVETLHHQNTHAINVDSSNFASGIVDTSMMMSPSTANGQPGIAVSDNNDMMYFLCGNSNSSTSTSISSNEARTSHQSSPATTGQWNEPARTSYKSPRSSGGTKSSHKKRHQSRRSSWTPSFPTSAVPITTRNPAAAAPAPAPFEQDPWLQTAAKMSSTDGIVWEE